MWRKPVEEECSSGTLRPDNKAFTMALSCFRVDLETEDLQEARSCRRTRHVEGRAEKNRSLDVGEHHAIIPSIDLQQHTKAQES